MQVRFVTKPPAKLTERRAEPCVAGVNLVDLVAVYMRLLAEMAERKKIDRRSPTWEYYSVPDRNNFSRQE
jgi:hypothetical protein